MREYYIYGHYKPNGDLFYIGMGKKNRAWSISDRNNLWKKIVSKYGEHSVVIINNDLTRDEAIELEKELIMKYGRIDINTGILSNLTNGGDGGSFGLKQSKETIAKRVKHLIGKSPSQEVRNKIGDKQKGSKNHYAKRVKDLITGKIYLTIKDASIETGMNYSTLRRQLSQGVKNHRFVYLDKKKGEDE